jgi:tRNA-specific 2-thiouridylase
MSGRTPNPCILCNTHIKWGALLKIADQLNCDYIATGHYAIIRNENGRYLLSSGVDVTKDQSYVLYGLSQEVLARTIFPIGGYEKKEIRQMAADRGFEDLSKKSESYEICFVPVGHFSDFLKFKRPELAHLDGGDIKLKDGTVVGKHHGYPFYTVGQRKGLGLSLGYTVYVTNIDNENNIIYVGGEEDLNKSVVYIDNFNYIKYPKIEDGIECIVKIRYKDRGTYARLYNAEDGLIKVEFLKEVKAPTLGQSAVALDYDNDVLGGGIIVKRM